MKVLGGKQQHSLCTGNCFWESRSIDFDPMLIKVIVVWEIENELFMFVCVYVGESVYCVGTFNVAFAVLLGHTLTHHSTTNVQSHTHTHTHTHTQSFIIRPL